MPSQRLFFLLFLALASSARADNHAAAGAGGRLRDFSLDAKTAQEAASTADFLHVFLDSLGYDAEMQKAFGDHYGQTTIFEEPDKARNFGSTARLKLAGKLFLLGEALSPEETEILFGKGSSLPKRLIKANLAVEKDGKLRLNDLSVSSYLLKKASPPRVMYLINDLPKEFSPAHAEPAAQISATSFSLLKSIEARQSLHQVKGVAADLGSGTGIQAIALLIMNPAGLRAVGLEIDPHQMNLSRFNGLLNGISPERFQVIDNTSAQADLRNNKPDPLARALQPGETLSLAVSNPPFNIVPASVKKQFPEFGYGGPDGLEITRTFLQQAMRKMGTQGEILMSGQFAVDGKGKPLLEKMLSNDVPSQGRGIKVEYASDPLSHLGYGNFESDLGTYAQTLHRYLSHDSGGKPVPTAAEIKKALEASGVQSLAPLVVHLTPGRGAGYQFGFLPRGFAGASTQPEEKLGGAFLQQSHKEVPSAGFNASMRADLEELQKRFPTLSPEQRALEVQKLQIKWSKSPGTKVAK